MTGRSRGERPITEHRKAFHDYHIIDTFEAGIVLTGTEVKAIREGRVNLRDSYGRVEAGEVFVYNIHISSYSHRGYADHEPTRRRDHVHFWSHLPAFRRLRTPPSLKETCLD